jgi:hypothetical protein
MKKFNIKIVISEQENPEKQLTASLGDVPEDRLLSSLVDFPLDLLVQAFKEAEK